MNSGVVILFLSGALIACMVRALKGNVAQSNQKKDSVSILFFIAVVVNVPELL